MTKEKKNLKFDSQRETRVLLEKIHSEVRTVAEGHGALVSKLDVVDTRLDEVDNRLGKIEANSFKTEMNIESIKSKVGTIDIKADRIERELETVKNAVIDIGAVTKGHEKRIKKVEEKLEIA